MARFPQRNSRTARRGIGDSMTAQEMIDQAREEAETAALGAGIWTLYEERRILRDIIRHLCDPEQHPYPMTSPEL